MITRIHTWLEKQQRQLAPSANILNMCVLPPTIQRVFTEPDCYHKKYNVVKNTAQQRGFIPYLHGQSWKFNFTQTVTSNGLEYTQIRKVFSSYVLTLRACWVFTMSINESTVASMQQQSAEAWAAPCHPSCDRLEPHINCASDSQPLVVDLIITQHIYI